MKHTLFILALITATIQTFAQSPRIKLNQITKDSISGSVLISSPTDSGMVYSRDLFISYGADTVLILGGDTLAATSSIISSVLSDGVTITGDGTTGSELTVDTVTVIATKGDLLDKQDQLNGTGFVKATGTTINYDNSTYLTSEVDGSVTNEGSLTVGAGGANDAVISSNTSGSSDVTISGGTNVTVTESGQTITIASSGGAIPVDTFVTIAGTETITGEKTFSSTVTGTSNLRAPKIQVGTSATINDVTGVANTLQLTNYTPTAFVTGSADNYIYKNSNGFGGLNAHSLIFQTRSDIDGGGFAFVGGSTPSAVVTILSSGDVGIGTTSPGYPLEMGSGAHVTTGGVWTDASDIKLKTNINYIYPYGLEDIMNLKPTMFDYKNGEKNSLGFIAQDIYEIIPEAISSTIDDNGNETMGLKMVSITATLTKAIQEQQSIIETQATEIEQLKTLITELSNRLTILENN